MIRRELFWFLIAGLSAVGTDMGTYYILLNWLSHSPAKAISFILGSFVAFLLNKILTFQKEGYSHGEVIRFAILYMLTLGANVSVNKLALLTMGNLDDFALLQNYNELIAFLAATGTSTVLNFLGQKFWVFK